MLSYTGLLGLIMFKVVIATSWHYKFRKVRRIGTVGNYHFIKTQHKPCNVVHSIASVHPSGDITPFICFSTDVL